MKKKTKLTVQRRYALARKLLTDLPREDRPLRFWNSYPSGTKSLKIYFFCDQSALVRKLAKLADYCYVGSRGGIVVGFRGVA